MFTQYSYIIILNILSLLTMSLLTILTKNNTQVAQKSVLTILADNAFTIKSGGSMLREAGDANNKRVLTLLFHPFIHSCI